jgi:DNA-binding response OmpR family regulator
MTEPSPTILLVDDEDSVRKVLAFPLERDGFTVVQAADGEEALRQFAAHKVDLVVLDIMLPRLDGLEVCKRLRATSTVPIMMLTARDDERIELDGLVIDIPRRAVEVRGAAVQLTYVEFELLRTLAAQPGRVFSRRMLLEALWKSADYRDPRTIDVHVRHLREKLEAEPRTPEYILTVRGVGYRFRDR